MKIFVFGFFLVSVWANSIYANTAHISGAIDVLRTDIRKEAQSLNNVRSKVSMEKVPLVKKTRALEDEVIALRKRVLEQKNARIQDEEAYERLREDVQFSADELQFCSSLINEYRREVASRMSAAEDQFYKERLSNIDSKIDSGSNEDVVLAVGPLLELVNSRVQKNMGGFVFKGACLDKSGVKHEGSFVLCGPIAYFVSKEGDVAGIADIKLGSTMPSLVFSFNPALLQGVLQGSTLAIPLDFTLGSAIKMNEIKTGWFEHIKAGGITMVPILGLGVICICVAFWKFISLLKLRTNTNYDLSGVVALISAGKIHEAEKKASNMGRPIGPVVAEGIEHRAASREHMEEIMHERILQQLPYLERGLPLLAVSAAASPLLGLLGTVTGMIHTFNLVTIFGTGKANLLSSGISEALVTTEYGLIIAVPALLIHAFLSRKVKNIIHALEQSAVSLINGIKIKKRNC